MMTAAMQAALYFSRKRNRERSEMTIGHGGMRNPQEHVGVIMTVTLTLH